jgi:hypothetical protein
VSATILPAVIGNPQLDLGPDTTQWWREHGQLPGEKSDVRTDEEKHLELSRIALNKSEQANRDVALIAARAENVMRLFAACLICQDTVTRRFPVARYASKRPAAG